MNGIERVIMIAVPSASHCTVLYCAVLYCTVLFITAHLLCFVITLTITNNGMMERNDEKINAQELSKVMRKRNSQS